MEDHAQLVRPKFSGNTALLPLSRLDARSCFRAADVSEESDAEAGIYERCVRGLPHFESLDAEISACPVCSSGAQFETLAKAHAPKSPGLPEHIQQEVDWRRQHTELLQQKIDMLERENAMWEKKLQALGRQSPGTSPPNKIIQLFPKQRPKMEVENEPPERQGHAFAMLAYEPEIGALLDTPSSARAVFQKMRNPSPLQPLQPRPKPKPTPEMCGNVETEQDVPSSAEAKVAEREAELERVQAEQREWKAWRPELQRGLQDELQQMRLLEEERRRRREQKRAELEDELQQQLEKEQKKWKARQARQELERKEREHRRDAQHHELMLVELERLRDKIHLKQQFSTAEVMEPHQVHERLQELLQARLKTDRRELPAIWDPRRLLVLKSFTWQSWLSSLRGCPGLDGSALRELEAAFPGKGLVSLGDMETGCEQGKLSPPVRECLERWAHEEGDRQAGPVLRGHKRTPLFCMRLLGMTAGRLSGWVCHRTHGRSSMETCCRVAFQAAAAPAVSIVMTSPRQ